MVTMHALWRLLWGTFGVVGVAAKSVDITDFGASGNGSLESTKDNAAAIAAAFDAAGEGGTVHVPAGTFFTGPVFYSADHQTLELAAGARLVAGWAAYGSMERKTFGISWPLGAKRPEGPPEAWDEQYAPLVYAHNLTGLALVGPGALDGGGEAWWNLKDKKDSHGKFPKNMKQRPFTVRFDGCHDVRVQDITLLQPPFWALVPTWSSRIRISNITILATPGDSGTHPYNTDGIEPMASVDVHVKGCFIINGDDSITIKSGSHDILVEDCTFQDGHGANIGSVQGEGISNVTFRNLKLNGTLLGGGRIKARHWVDEWVVVRDVLFENITCVEGVDKCAKNHVAEIDMTYGGGPFGKAGVTVMNATWRNINVTGAHHAGSFNCFLGNPCKDIRLEHVHIMPPKDNYTCNFTSGTYLDAVPPAYCLSEPLPPTPSPVPSPVPSPSPMPPSPPSPSPSGTCALRTDTCAKGDDLAKFRDINETEACCAKCAETPGCQCFTLTLHGGAPCRLLSGQCEFFGKSPGCTAGTVVGPSPPPPFAETRCAGARPDDAQWVPEAWEEAAARGGLIWADGSRWEGLPWRGRQSMVDDVDD